MTDYFIYTLISGAFVAIASGLIGSFLVLKKMTLMSDALSHVALPGIALGVIFKFEPIIGGLLFLFLSIILIWGIENKTKLATESITGVLFVTALAVGSILISETELLEAFFGNVEDISPLQLLIQTIIAIGIIGIVAKNFKSLMLVSIAPDLTYSEKISRTKLELLLLVLIALTISIGIGFVGVLLMSALSIIPAVTARNLSRNLKMYIWWSMFIATLSLIGGIIISHFTQSMNPGVATVLISTFFFLISLFGIRK
ncbi:MAG: metal ABC transporter permease [Patescibacteria group bacterium]